MWVMKELRILNGIKKGASISLDGESLRIGSALESELILDEPGIERKHVEISTLNEQEIKVKPLDGGVRNYHGEEMGGVWTLNVGTPFLLNKTWVVIQDSAQPWPTRLPEINRAQEKPKSHLKKEKFDRLLERLVSTKVLVSFSIFFLIFLGAKTFANTSKNIPKNVMVSDSIGANSEQTLEKINVEKQARQKIFYEKQQGAITIIERMLAEREILGIKIEAQDNSIVLHGDIDPLSSDILARLLIRYHQQYAEYPTVKNATALSSQELPFKIVSIMSGPFGHIVTADGERLTKGQTKQGYTLENIEKGLLSFSGQQRIEVNW